MSDPFAIGRNAKVKEARTRSDYDEFQWHLFYKITKGEVDALPQDECYYHFKTIPEQKMEQILASTQSKLREKSIPEIKQDVFDWRVARLIHER
ncbi:hypothetical protein COCHEDRAFT_1146333, partial [Bipolaris maydis C5]